MPISNIGSVENGIRLALKISPDSVLDVGFGFGMWGFLLREYLDVRRFHTWKGLNSANWKVRVDGVDVFEKYVRTPGIEYLYDNLYAMPAAQLFRRLGQDGYASSYDLVIFSHVLEHMPKDEGLFCIEKALATCGNVIIGLPIHDHEEKVLSFGNPHEAHSSEWEDALESLKSKAEISFIEEGSNLLAWIKGAKYVNKTPPDWEDRFRR